MICNEWINACNARIKLMYVMQEQIDASNAIMIFEVHEWSFKSFSLIKSWVQNWVSAKLLCQNVTDYAILFFLIATMANKWKRGRNLYTKFKKQRKHGRIPITIPPVAQGPVGENSSVFTRRVGVIVREHVNLSYQTWCKAPKEHWQMLKNRLVISCYYRGYGI